MRHIPTGIESKAAAKSQHPNRQTARIVLEQRVITFHKRNAKIELDKNRKEKQGSGMRGNKIRTYREQDDLVNDHKNEKKIRLKKLRGGDLSDL